MCDEERNTQDDTEQTSEEPAQRPYDLHESAGFSRGECGGELDWLKYMDCEGDESEPGRYSGMVGISSNTCCATGRAAPRFGPDGAGAGSAEFMTPCTRGSCEMASVHPSGPGVDGGLELEAAPRPSQMQRRSLPGMICASRPVST